MPELPQPKARPHPARAMRNEDDAPAANRPPPAVAYAALEVTSNFTFLTGASHPDELVLQAAVLGHHAIALTDTNSLAGVVRAHSAAQELPIRAIVGCRLRFTDPADPAVLVYPTDRAAYGRLCRLLTTGKRRAPKGECHLRLHDLIEHGAGLLAVVVPTDVLDERFLQTLAGLRDVFDGDRLSLAAAALYGDDDAARLRQLADLSRHARVPLVATNDVHYHLPGRRALQDALTCVRHGCTIQQAGYRLFPHAERHLKPPEEMARLFAACPGAVARTVEIADRAAAFSLDQLRYEYPDEVVPPGLTPMQHLVALTWRGAAERYPAGVPEPVRRQIEHEFALIEELHFAPYFLTVHDIVVFARGRGILCQGRGAAANSAVCYCLGVTAVDPERVNVLFERFVSKERHEPPDIDIDFEHERREEVIQYLYQKYGRDRAALTAEVISYRPRSAVRDLGKALGLSLDAVDRLAKDLDWWDPGAPGSLPADRLTPLGFRPDDPTIIKLAALVTQVQGFPRHLGQHVGGFVITRGPLCESVPIENAAMPDRTIIEWDKDDIDALGMLKVDVLGLGMLTCLRKSMELIERHHARPLTLATIPAEDPATYEMICKADTVGVFQIESRAQMSMLPRLRPVCYYDLVIEVAIVRPGPIQGNMVHPYLRRRNGQEPVTYPDEAVRKVLSRTLGVPLFQEQAMALAIVAAGFTPGEADQLRRAIAAWKQKTKLIYHFGAKLIDGMIANGYERQFAENCFEQIKGFSEYGFPESHAASFALLVYASCWIKRHYPAAFACALLNSQPMGFYAPAQIVRDAQEHGVEARTVDVQFSQWDCTLEAGDPAGPASRPGGPSGPEPRSDSPALRLGMRMIRGMREHEARALADAVARHGPAGSIETLWRRSGVRAAALRTLAAADAFRSMGLDRQGALWQIGRLSDVSAPLFEQADSQAADEPVTLPAVPEPAKVARDYAAVGLSLRSHPVAFLRPKLDRMGVRPARDLRDESRCPQNTRLRVAGLILLRQRPGTAKGIVFMTMEDETGSINLIVRPRVYERYRRAARHATMLLVEGHVERQGQVVHVIVRRLRRLDDLNALSIHSRDFH